MNLPIFTPEFILEGGLPVKSPTCPSCGYLPLHVLGNYRQAFCPSDDCRVFTWNPRNSAEHNLSGGTEIEIPVRQG